MKARTPSFVGLGPKIIFRKSRDLHVSYLPGPVMKGGDGENE